MKLFLASSLSIVGDIITQHTHIQGAKVGCIWNAADADGGKSARWNMRDYNFFVSSGALCQDIDLHQTNNRSEIWNEIDILFVGGGDTLHLRDLSESSGLHTAIHDFLGSGGIYMGTSAGSMLPCHDVYYPHSGRDTRGFDIFPLMIIPHRGSPDFLSDRENNIKKMNDHGLSYLLLTDIDVLIIDNNNRAVQRTSHYTIQDVVDKVRQEIDNQ